MTARANLHRALTALGAILAAAAPLLAQDANPGGLRRDFFAAVDAQTPGLGADYERAAVQGVPLVNRLDEDGVYATWSLILWHETADPECPLVEVRAVDRAGLLAALTAVFERAGADIAWAKITTLGSSLIDVFPVTLPAGLSRQSLERDLYAVLPTPPPAKPVQEAG